MKNNRKQDSAVKYPLSAILGSRGHLVVLRELFRSGNPVSHSELLERTDLSRQGVYDVTKRLTETGVAAYSGSGRQQLIGLRRDFPLYDSLNQLFSSELKVYENFLETLKQIIGGLGKKPESVWIFGDAALGYDEYGDPIQLAVLGKLKEIDDITREFREKIMVEKVEHSFDVTIDVRGVTIADLEARPFLTEGAVIRLWGLDPDNYLNPQTNGFAAVHGHQDFDERSLAESEVWSELLKSNPEIIPRTIKYLESRIREISNGEKSELLEWKHLLRNCSPQRLKKFLTSDSERATRLRQSLPFWPVLTEHEQKKFKIMIGELLNI